MRWCKILQVCGQISFSHAKIAVCSSYLKKRTQHESKLDPKVSYFHKPLPGYFKLYLLVGQPVQLNPSNNCPFC